jgi:hypothetical protein
MAYILLKKFNSFSSKQLLCQMNFSQYAKLLLRNSVERSLLRNQEMYWKIILTLIYGS